MYSERDLLLEKLSDLEDESAAVKVSLIQLLQEKSATNKTLALENYRLSRRVSYTDSILCTVRQYYLLSCILLSTKFV